MADRNNETISVLNTESIEYPTTSFLDVNNEVGGMAFKQALESSKGKAFIFVHATSHLDDIVTSSESQVEAKLRKNYSQKVGKLLDDIPPSIPVLMLIEGDQSLRERFSFSDSTIRAYCDRACSKLKKQVNQLSKKHLDRLFYVVTIMGGPSPVKQYIESDPVNGSPLNSFIEQLKAWGLKNAYLVGTKLKTDELTQLMRDLGELPSHSDNMLPASLEVLDQYSKRIKSSSLSPFHPLRRVDPDGCVSATFRALVNCGVESHYTQITYPLKLPRTH